MKGDPYRLDDESIEEILSARSERPAVLIELPIVPDRAMLDRVGRVADGVYGQSPEKMAAIGFFVCAYITITDAARRQPSSEEVV